MDRVEFAQPISAQTLEQENLPRQYNIEMSSLARTGVDTALSIGKVGLESSVRLVALTSTESLNLELLSNGLTRQEAADSLGNSPHTIEKHRKTIGHKLRAHNSVHAVRRGFELGYLYCIDLKEHPSKALSGIETDVLKLASMGFNNVEIAKIRLVAVETIKTQRVNIIQKLNALNMAHAVRIGFELDILEIEE